MLNTKARNRVLYTASTSADVAPPVAILLIRRPASRIPLAGRRTGHGPPKERRADEPALDCFPSEKAVPNTAKQ